MMRRALLLLVPLALLGGLASGCGEPEPPKDNSHIVEPPAPPPPGAPATK